MMISEPASLAFALGVVQRVPQQRLEFERRVAGQGPRRDVELDVVAAEFGLVSRVGDRLQHLGVGHRRLPVGVDQVEFDLQPGELAVEVEGVLDQHPLEDVQAPAHLVPVALSLLAGEGGRGDVVAHAVLPFCGPGRACRG